MHKSTSASSLGPGGLDLAQAFFKPIQGAARPSSSNRQTKISAIGAGNVGMAIAHTILTQDLADEGSMAAGLWSQQQGSPTRTAPPSLSSSPPNPTSLFLPSSPAPDPDPTHSATEDVKPSEETVSTIVPGGISPIELSRPLLL